MAGTDAPLRRCTVQLSSLFSQLLPLGLGLHRIHLCYPKVPSTDLASSSQEWKSRTPHCLTRASCLLFLRMKSCQPVPEPLTSVGEDVGFQLVLPVELLTAARVHPGTQSQRLLRRAGEHESSRPFLHQPLSIKGLGGEWGRQGPNKTPEERPEGQPSILVPLKLSNPAPWIRRPYVREGAFVLLEGLVDQHMSLQLVFAVECRLTH